MTPNPPYTPPRPGIAVRSASIRTLKRRVILPLNLLALIGVAMAIYEVTRGQILGWEIGIWLGMTSITLLGVGVGYHRYFSHRSFKTFRPIEIGLAIAASMAGQGTLSSWVSIHRCHHQYCDVPGDPHSPNLHGEGFQAQLQGLWHAHMGWLLDDSLPNSFLFAKDILQDPVLSRINRLYFLWLALGFLLPAAIGGAITWSWQGAVQGLIWGGFIRFIWSFHFGYLVNAIGHKYGRRWLQCNDLSTNIAWLALPTFGESWHNNHHAFPNSARFGLRWWQIDPNFGFIRLLALLGLVWDIKSPSAEMIEAKIIS